MTRNRRGTHRRPTDGDGPVWHLAGGLFTLLLLAPAAAVLASRIRGLIEIERLGAPGCSGAQALGPVLQQGLPAVALVIAIPVALLSLGHRARGWIWLLAVLLGTVALEIAVRLWLPGCS